MSYPHQRATRAPSSEELWWISVLVTTALAVILWPLDSPVVSLAVRVMFVLWAPGAVVVAYLPDTSWSLRACLAPGSSVAVLLLLSALLLQIHFWHPAALMALLMIVSAAVAVRGLWPSVRAPQ